MSKESVWIDSEEDCVVPIDFVNRHTDNKCTDNQKLKDMINKMIIECKEDSIEDNWNRGYISALGILKDDLGFNDE